MLKYFFDHQLIHYPDKEITDWREAIAESCRVLIDKNIIDQTYVEEIIHCVEKYGPYIVIAPQVAMPHSSEKSEGVFGTAISFTKLKQPVRFESEGENEEKTVSLFFTLAAKNPEEHPENIQKLSELLMTDGLVERLISTNSIDDYQVVMAEYN
ncbi:PTS sugar transporter subunit IIA [Enterococcus lactis]|uniref:PTS sugar transporter subunit IIA n=1 Tax=Enterococcus lactis TaxID=357441 RepID=UPI002412CECC|nr:PTS sugar transporter subunit IIA [Enterococcus lactis]